MALIGYHTLIDQLYHVLRHDYAGFAEKGDWAFFGPRSGIFATDVRLNCDGDLSFLLAVRRLLQNMAEPNLRFSTSHNGILGDWSTGFDVRATEDSLYVTAVRDETRLALGDRLVSLDGHDIPFLRRSFQAFRRLYGNTPERELWMGVIKDSFRADVIHADGSKEDFRFHRFPVSGPVAGSAGAGAGAAGAESAAIGTAGAAAAGMAGAAADFRMIDGGEGARIAYLRVDSFGDPDGLKRLLDSAHDDIAGAKKLIIDVREGHEGTIDGFLPLLSHVCRTPMRLTELVGPQQVYVNYTEANCRRMMDKIAATEAELIAQGADAATLAFVDNAMAEYGEKSGMGMILEDDTDWDDLDFDIVPAPGPDDVVILTDLLCADAFELFVSTARNSPAVRLVGRATMGSIDYSMPVDYIVDDYFTFTYSMAKSKAVGDREHDSVDGILADVHVPWTPDECLEDMILQTAIAL